MLATIVIFIIFSAFPVSPSPVSPSKHPVHLRSAHQGAPHAAVHAQAMPAGAGHAPHLSSSLLPLMTALSPLHQCSLFIPNNSTPCPNTSCIPQIPIEHLLYARLCVRCWGYKLKDLVPSVFKEHTVYRGMVEGPRGRGSPDLDLQGQKAGISLPFRTSPLAAKWKGVPPCQPLSPSLQSFWLLTTHLKLIPTTHLKFWAQLIPCISDPITNTSFPHTKCFSPHSKYSQPLTPKSHPLCPVGVEPLT